MKFKFLLIPILILSFACQNNPKKEVQQAEEQTNTTEQQALANVAKVQINIEGMTCTGCENTIQNTVKEFDGVYTVSASHEQGIAVLEIDSTKVDISKIEEAINQVGYKATGHEKLSE